MMNESPAPETGNLILREIEMKRSNLRVAQQFGMISEEKIAKYQQEIQELINRYVETQ